MIALLMGILFYPFKVFQVLSYYQLFEPIRRLLNIYMRMYPGITLYMAIFYIMIILSWS